VYNQIPKAQFSVPQKPHQGFSEKQPNIVFLCLFFVLFWTSKKEQINYYLKFFFHFFLDGKVEQKIKTNVYSATFVLIRYSTVVLLKTQQQIFIQLWSC